MPRTPQGHLTCVMCGETKPRDEFRKKHDRPTSRDRRSSYCHPCRNRALRDYNLRRKYGIDLDTYEEMLEAQGGVCAICGRPPSPNRRLAVDHSHETGAVRALLCVPCNALLGNARESQDILSKAAKYLQDHAPTQVDGPSAYPDR